MIYSETLQYVYFAIPKTASTAIANTLCCDFDGHVLNDQHDSYVPPEYKDFFHFASVRNPYARAVSAYRYVNQWWSGHHAVKMPLEWFWNTFHAVSMSDFMRHYVHAPGPIPPHLGFKAHIGDKPGPGLDMTFIHVENLDEEFSKLPFVNKSYHIKASNKCQFECEIPTDTILDYVARNYGEDFERFGYNVTQRNLH